MIQNEVLQCINKMQTFLESKNYKHFELFQADNKYFDLTLEERKILLKAPSEANLCKSIIMENTAYEEKFAEPSLYPKYICVVIQYVTKMQVEKINKFLKSKQNAKYPELCAPRNKFHFRLTSEEMSKQLSGYDFNAITPFNFNVEMPLIVSDRLVNLDYIWFGGGHKEVKLRMNVQEMIEKHNHAVYVADIVY